MVRNIEWTMDGVLGNGNDRPTEGVCDADFVHDVRIVVGQIGDDYPAAIDQGEDVLNDSGIFPDLVGTLAFKARITTSNLDRAVYRVER